MSLISRIKLENWWNGQLPVYREALSKGDLSVIPDLYSVFGSSKGTKSEAHHKKKAAAILCACLDQLDSHKIMALLDRFGYSSRMEWFVDWREQRPATLLTTESTTPAAISSRCSPLPIWLMTSLSAKTVQVELMPTCLVD